jgi:RNA polymerase sigma-70 factor, ECF subfamily
LPVQTRADSGTVAFSKRYAERSENELLIAARSGDQRAFGQLCERYTGALKRRIFRIIGNAGDSEDIVQDTMLTAYQQLPNFRGTAKFYTWLSRIGTNHALMLLRKRKVRSVVNVDIVSSSPREQDQWEFPDRSPNPEQVCANRQVVDFLQDAIGKLPKKYREIVKCFPGDESQMTEIAKSLAVTVPAVKLRLFRARHTLRRFLVSRKITSSAVC